MSAGTHIGAMPDGTEYRLAGAGPYYARSASDKTDNWRFWYVTDAHGRGNLLSFPGGKVLTSRADAEWIANDATQYPVGMNT